MQRRGSQPPPDGGMMTETKTKNARFMQPVVPALPLNQVRTQEEFHEQSFKTMPATQWSKVFESKKMSVMQIAAQNKDRMPHYKTILGQGGGTFGGGALARKQMPSSALNGQTQLSMGQPAQSGVVFNPEERSYSVGREKKRLDAQAHNLFV